MTVTDDVIAWFDAHSRDLPWRDPDTSPWGVLVSEVMLQQTPVTRVQPIWDEWMTRWPQPSDLAAEPAAAAIRAWGRLGYPRRAIRLHATATILRDEFDNQVPTSIDELRSLPGVGEYTAAAVRCFAYGYNDVVLDINIRRFLLRCFRGQFHPAGHLTSAERQLATSLLPDADKGPAWTAAAMELGQLICTASSPACPQCPARQACQWLDSGAKEPGRRPSRQAQYENSDRYVRGLILQQLRTRMTSSAEIQEVWSDTAQVDACLASLVADGLIVATNDAYHLPGDLPE